MLTIPIAFEILAKWGPVVYDKAVELHKLWKLKQEPTDEQWGNLSERINALNYDRAIAEAEARAAK
tara:strand:- start:39 stop:236 length:198 start_codon:yes stop_codon:yes gene_type:complete